MPACCLLQVPNFHKLSAMSLLAAVMSIGYSTIAIGVSAHAGRQSDAKYNLDGFTQADGIFGIFNALGTIAFAYGGHNVVLEIQVSCNGLSCMCTMRHACALNWVSRQTIRSQHHVNSVCILA